MAIDQRVEARREFAFLLILMFGQKALETQSPSTIPGIRDDHIGAALWPSHAAASSPRIAVLEDINNARFELGKLGVVVTALSGPRLN